MTKGASKGLSRKFLEDYLKVLAGQQDWKMFNTVLALLICGLVLFPFVPGMIDQPALDVFYRWEMERVNPVPAILAETFLTMEICHRNQAGKLRCCAQLLYVWIMTHMFGQGISDSLNPLKDFDLKPKKQQGPYEWKQEFDSIDLRTFTWVCPWYKGETVLMSCGDLQNVPLMGPRGCISYTPSLVIGQLNGTIDKPREETLGGMSFLYPHDVTGQANKVRAAWKDKHIIVTAELGKRMALYTPRYADWRKARRGETVPPNPTISTSKADAKTKEQVERGKMYILKAQLDHAENNLENAKIEIEILKEENKNLKERKEEQADTSEQQRAGKRARNTGLAKEKEVEKQKEEAETLKKEVEYWMSVAEKQKEEAETLKKEVEYWRSEAEKQKGEKADLQKKYENN